MTAAYTPEAIDVVVRAALAEDAPFGDLTSEAFVPPGARAHGVFAAREECVLACGDVIAAVMAALAPGQVRVSELVPDGTRLAAGGVLAVVDGPARTVLRGERVALNLLSRMCAVATRTAAYVAAVGDATSATGRPVRVVDTRKTTPGLRALEKHAVVAGGGYNHRYSLSDAVMVKDNHLAALIGQRGARRRSSPPRCARPPPGCPTPPTSRWRWTGWSSSNRCWPPGWPARSCWTTSP